MTAICAEMVAMIIPVAMRQAKLTEHHVGNSSVTLLGDML
jgi:hypothetical protein